VDPYIGQIMMVGFNFAPRGWALCNGQLLSIAQNTALFSLLGTYYGGDGRTTFGLPDLRGRMPIHQGQGSGLTNRTIGQPGGEETVSLSSTQMPQHTHLVAAQSGPGNSTNPTNNYPAASSARDNIYSNTANTTMNAQMDAPSGGGQPHDNMSPYLTINFIIATEGIFPPRD